MRRAAAAVTALALAAATAACSDSKPKQAAPTTTASTAAPTTTTTAAPTTTTTAALAPSPNACPTPPPQTQPRNDRPKYRLSVDVKPSENKATGRVEVTFQPDLPTDKLVFRLWPNGPRTARAGASLAVGSVTVRSTTAASSQPDPTTLVVPLSPPLKAGETLVASVAFTLTLPRPVDDRVSRSGDAVRLGSFFPILSWEPGVGWATEPATSAFAEASVAPAADITASVTVPTGFDVLASGVPDGAGNWTSNTIGDFALSVGHFRTVTAQAGPTKVVVGVDSSVDDDPNVYLPRIVNAINDFAARYGPYPWPSYTVAITPNLRGGIEYPMFVMQGPDTQGRTTPHEVAHMWFFGLVVNNQGRDPWIDEGLASWAEARHLGVLKSFTAKAIPAAGRGHAGEPMTFWETRQSAYYRSVYVQPVHALAALGPPDLVDCALRLFVARYGFRVATPKDLIDVLASVFPDAPATLARFGLTP